jgi:toxin ParE1/3/4
VVRKYKVREKADADLTDIYLHTIMEFGEQQTERCIMLLTNSFQLLAENPGLGQKCDYVSAELLRFFPSETTHSVYFRITAYGIDIVRVLHQTMDTDQQEI